MPITPDELHFDTNDLEPFMSAKTVRAHRVHEQRIVTRVAQLMQRAGGNLESFSLMRAYEVGCQHDAELALLAQEALSHSFFWRGLRPPSLRTTAPAFRDLVRRTHGSMGELVRAAGAVVRTSPCGWLWLVLDRPGVPAWYAGANPPWPPLLVVDLAEHAFWLDYPAESVSGPSSCEQYVVTVLEQLVDWGRVELRLRHCQEQRATGRSLC